MIKNADGWIDVTYPIRPGMTPWPGQPPVVRERVNSLAAGDHSNVSVLSLSVHTGTHLDAPAHFLPDGADVTAVPLDALLGPTRVAKIEASMITSAALEAYEARRGLLQKGDRVLFRTANSEQDWTKEPFREDYVAVEADAAALLVTRGVRTVGVDYLSVAPFSDTATTHWTLLTAGIWIIEGLDSRQVQEKNHELLALPLPLSGSDAAPMRVLLRPVT